jgi:protein N-terminal methyltransferase
MGEFYNVGLQDWIPAPGFYDCIWVQWVLPHLTDDDLVSFFQRCASGLTPTGVLCVKESITNSGFNLDNEDMSVTRSDFLYKKAFRRAGLTILREDMQSNFPQDLF